MVVAALSDILINASSEIEGTKRVVIAIPGS